MSIVMNRYSRESLFKGTTESAMSMLTYSYVRKYGTNQTLIPSQPWTLTARLYAAERHNR